MVKAFSFGLLFLWVIHGVTLAAPSSVTSANRKNFFQPYENLRFGCEFNSPRRKANPISFSRTKLAVGVKAVKIVYKNELSTLLNNLRQLKEKRVGARGIVKYSINSKITKLNLQIREMRTLPSVCRHFNPAQCSDGQRSPFELGVDCGGPCLTSCDSLIIAPTPTPVSCIIREDQINADTPLTHSQLNESGRLVMTDITDSNRPKDVIVAPPFAMFNNPALTSSVVPTSARNGVDLAITLTNNTNSIQPMGQVFITGLVVGRYVDFFDFRQGSETESVDLSRFGDGQNGEWWAGHSWNGPAYLYPNDLLSPLIVVRGAEYTFGISLLYPVLEYKHDVSMQFFRPFGEPNAGAVIHLNSSLAPGETRTYTITLRIVRRDDDWLRTILPYRNYFRENYGGVEYERDPRPVLPLAAAFTNLLSDSNPYGYLNNLNQRPDLHGWGPWADEMIGYKNDGYERIMFWAPTGVYGSVEGLPENYPMLFMTPMLDRPMMRDSLDQLRRVPASGIQMGYYQGYGSRIHYDWDHPRPETINPDNPEHQRHGFAEVDMAYSLNAGFIGLDAITIMPMWDALRWADMLKARSSKPVRFLGELTPSDLWLKKHASFVFSHTVSGPDRLADFLLPGHEVWSGIRYDVIFHGQWNIPADTILNIMRQEAVNGRVPVPFSSAPMPITSDYYAARSWERTVPAELQDPCYRIEHPGQ